MDTTSQNSTPIKDEQLYSIRIKGVPEGLLVTLPAGEWDTVQYKFLEQITENEVFFKGAKLIIDVGNRVLKVSELGFLRNHLISLGISLAAIYSTNSTTVQTAQLLGVETSKAQKIESKRVSTKQSDQYEPTLIIEQGLSKGNRIVHGGHVVILGDVQVGSEIIASGSVIVWGRLRGAVHAGAEGNDLAFVCALEMVPSQLRIANQFFTPPMNKRKFTPELLRVENNRVISQTWEKKFPYLR